MLTTLLRILELAFAFVILFEEWGWDPLERRLGRLIRRTPLAGLEDRIVALPPYAALAVFGLPALALLPVKLAALALIADDRPVAGLLLIVAAKLVGTAIVARLFALTQPQLMRLGWFAASYGRWLRWKAALLARARASRAGLAVGRMTAAARRRWRRG